MADITINSDTILYLRSLAASPGHLESPTSVHCPACRRDGAKFSVHVLFEYDLIAVKCPWCGLYAIDNTSGKVSPWPPRHAAPGESEGGTT